MNFNTPKLLTALEQLESSIERAKHCLDAHHLSDEQFADAKQRIQSYEEIVHKQKTLADNLLSHLEVNNWKEVTRHANLINGLTELIFEDTVELAADIYCRQDDGKPPKETLC